MRYFLFVAFGFLVIAVAAQEEDRLLQREQIKLDNGGGFTIPADNQLRLSWELLEGMAAKLSISAPAEVSRKVVYIRMAAGDTLAKDSLVVAGFEELTATPGVYEFRIDNHSTNPVVGKLEVGTLSGGQNITHGKYQFSKTLRITGEEGATASVDVLIGDKITTTIYSLKKLKKKAAMEIRLNEDLHQSFTKRHPNVSKAEKDQTQDESKALEGFGFLGFRKKNKKKVITHSSTAGESGAMTWTADKLSKFPIDLEVTVSRDVRPTYLPNNFEPIIIPPPPPPVYQLVFFYDQQIVLAPAEDYVRPSVRQIQLPLLELELDTLIKDPTARLIFQFECLPYGNKIDTTYLEEVTVLQGSEVFLRDRLSLFTGDVQDCQSVKYATVTNLKATDRPNIAWDEWRNMRRTIDTSPRNWQYFYVRNQEQISQSVIRIKAFIKSTLSP